MTPPVDIVPVHGQPDYGITPTGEVWRLRRFRPYARYPVPRRVEPVMIGGRTRRVPHVRFDAHQGDQVYAPATPRVSRSVASLMREHFPDLVGPRGRGR